MQKKKDLHKEILEDISLDSTNKTSHHMKILEQEDEDLAALKTENQLLKQLNCELHQTLFFVKNMENIAHQ